MAPEVIYRFWDEDAGAWDPESPEMGLEVAKVVAWHLGFSISKAKSTEERTLRITEVCSKHPEHRAQDCKED